MATSHFRWTNPEELRSLAEKIARDAAADVLAGATERAPVDTGTLARSITSRRDFATATKVRYVVGTAVFYAPFVEFGTRFMAAQPYLGPALEAARRRFR